MDGLKAGIQNLRSTITDGRLANVRHRQNEFHRLHTVLRDNAAEICNAICLDASSTPVQAEMEFFLAMDSIRVAYGALDFDASLEKEYLVKFGKNNTARCVGRGLVAIRAQSHSRLYSIISPMAAAFAAGNCVVLELEDSSSKLCSLLRDILQAALDRDVLMATHSRLQPGHIAEVDLFIDQTISFSSNAVYTASPNMGFFRSIAIVDRTADMQQAAKDIFNSRISPNHNSAYSPDLVLINDFLAEDFMNLCLKYSNESTKACVSGTAAKTSAVMEFQEVLAEAEAAGDVKTHFGRQISVVQIHKPSSPLAMTRVEGPFVVILPTTSVTSTVTTQQSRRPFHASYIYADNATAKVLAEQIPSAASYINQIPKPILIGPAVYPHALHPRYNPSMFNVSSPQFVTLIPDSTPPLPDQIMKLATAPLKSTGQRPGYAIGFFEQGILIGLGLSAFVVLPGATWMLWTAMRKAWILALR